MSANLNLNLWFQLVQLRQENDDIYSSNKMLTSEFEVNFITFLLKSLKMSTFKTLFLFITD